MNKKVQILFVLQNLDNQATFLLPQHAVIKQSNVCSPKQNSKMPIKSKSVIIAYLETRCVRVVTIRNTFPPMIQGRPSHTKLYNCVSYNLRSSHIIAGPIYRFRLPFKSHIISINFSRTYLNTQQQLNKCLLWNLKRYLRNEAANQTKLKLQKHLKSMSYLVRFSWNKAAAEGTGVLSFELTVIFYLRHT